MDDARRAWSVIADLFLSQAQHDRFHAVCDELGLPHPGALKLLLLLPERAAPTMGEIAGIINCDASYVTSLVDALEGPGFAERRPSDTDRRVKLIHLTDAGAEALVRAREILSEPPPIMDRLSDDEVRTLADLLDRLVADPEPAFRIRN